MPAAHQRDFLQKLRVILVFTEFNILIFRNTTFPTASTTATASASPQENKKATKPLIHVLDPPKKRKRILQQPPGGPNTHLNPRILEFCQDATPFSKFIHSFYFPCLGPRCFVWGGVMLLVWDFLKQQLLIVFARFGCS